MITIATLGPENSHAWQAAKRYAPNARIIACPHTSALINGFSRGDFELAIVPIYNTREGENKEYFRMFDNIKSGFWIDNIVLASHLSLGVASPGVKKADLRMLVGKGPVFRQCEEYVAESFAELPRLNVPDIDRAMRDIRENNITDRGVIDTEEMLKTHGLHILEREVAQHNRTRYAVLGPELAVETGYDATAFITKPLDDRVGLLVDILSEFSRRGVSLLDMRAESDIKTQKLQVYIEAEGHIQDLNVSGAIEHIENKVIGRTGSVRLLGSFPRIDMRTKFIKTIGFIGTGDMSKWFADRLENEGYRILMSGRSTELRPERMIPQADAVVVCVPISATSDTVRQYGPLIEPGKALILLAGESENILDAALQATNQDVEVLLVHNLWGPQAANMKNKNAIVVRTPRSGKLCNEFETFLYKHGAEIFQDSAERHDLLMGMGQKLPSIISVALAMTLDEHNITSDDISSHCTLTSLYPILAMARVHSQNPRTYAEILSTSGDSRKIVHDFAKNLQAVIDLADNARIAEICDLINKNSDHLTSEFLKSRMAQAKAVDEVLGKLI